MACNYLCRPFISASNTKVTKSSQSCSKIQHDGIKQGLWSFSMFEQTWAYPVSIRLVLIQFWSLMARLTHWGRVTHICVSKLTIIGSDNGLSPDRRQAIIWTNAGLLLIGPLGTNFSEILIEILTFSFKKMRLKVSSAKWRPFCLGLNVLNAHYSSNRSHFETYPRKTQLHITKIQNKQLHAFMKNLHFALICSVNCLTKIVWKIQQNFEGIYDY